MKGNGSFYNVYRPKRFDQVLGQDQSIAILKKQAQLNAFSHAYLLYGSSGTGKTSTARILAMALNCSGMDGIGEPCGICQSCRTIYEGHNWDVLEIDGASQRGIDDIRDLKYKANFYPLGNRKVYIIDEAHQITNSALDAMLKLLEEPPPHLCIILCTTQPEKLPLTVQSRCQRYEFKPVKAKHIEQKLMRIAEDWGVKFENVPDMLKDNLTRAINSGNVREAENAFEQIVILAV